MNYKKRKPVSEKEISIYFYLLLLVILPIILNWKIMNYEFTGHDDRMIIVENYGFLSDFKNVLKAFEMDNFMSKEGKAYYRPVQTVSFMIDAQIGDEKPFIYHLSNILYHILTVILLFFLLIKIGIRNNISFFVSLLFSIHPLFTDAIAWIPGRGDILAGLFCSVSFLAFICYQNNRNKWFFIVHSAAFLLALFSKEISISLPFLILTYYWFKLKNNYKLKVIVPFIVTWCVSIGLFFYLRNLFLNVQDILSVNAFIKNLPVIPIIFGKLIIPMDLSAMPVYDNLYTVIGSVLFALSGFIIWKYSNGNKPLIIIGTIWFVGFIMPPMFAALNFTKVHSHYLECRAYLPAIGIFIILGVILNENIKSKGNNILLKSFIPVIIIFSIITYNYSGNFSDTITFYSSLIKSNPGNAYALSQRGCEYLKTKNFELALVDFDNSIKAKPTFSDPYFNKGIVYHFMNDPVSAEHFLSIALNYDTLYTESASLNEDAFINLSSEKLTLKKYGEMKILLKAGLRKYPDNCSMHNNLGLAYYSTAEFDSAIYEYNKAINAEKNQFPYYNNRGMAEYKNNDFIKALSDFKKTLELKPEFLDALGNMGMTKVKLDDYEGAVNDLTRVINIRKNVGALWYFRGIAFSKINKLADAETDWEKARKLGFNEPQAVNKSQVIK
jgi:protein O-mannosyl-transferase